MKRRDTYAILLIYGLIGGEVSLVLRVIGFLHKMFEDQLLSHAEDLQTHIVIIELLKNSMKLIKNTP